MAWSARWVSRAAALILSVGTLGTAGRASGQELQIGIIDFFGLDRVSEGEARRALPFKEGATISPGDALTAILSESERRLATLPGVARAQVNVVCCEAGRWIAYVGVEEKGRAALSFRAAPRGRARLAADIVRAGHELDEAWMAAVQRGDADEDDSQGHALFHDPAARAVQERFIGYAARDLKELRRVLRDSSDAEQRALAAQVLGYVAHKQAVVGDLVYAMRDPSGDVRNNAMRALAGRWVRENPLDALRLMGMHLHLWHEVEPRRLPYPSGAWLWPVASLAAVYLRRSAGVGVIVLMAVTNILGSH